MKIIRQLLVATALIGAASPSVVYAQGTTPDTPSVATDNSQRPQDQRHDSRTDARGAERSHDRRAEGPRRPGGPRHGLLDLAATLNAAETALGVTAEQEDAWRSFAAAAVAFANAGRSNPPAEGQEPSRQTTAGPAAAPSDNGGDSADASEEPLQEHRALRRIERMVDGHVEQGKAAERLRSAMDELSDVLTPAQIDMADRLIAEAGPRGPGRHGARQRDGGPDRQSRMPHGKRRPR